MHPLKTVEYYIFNWAKITPDKIAIHFKDESVSYSHLALNVLNVTNFITKKYGIKKGEIVYIIADKTPSFIYYYFALHFCGAIAVILDSEITSQRFNLIRSLTQPKICFGKPTKSISKAYITEMDIIDNYDVCFNFNELVFPILNDKADILFTTGTTGTPKGVYLTNGNISAAVRNINSVIKNTENDIELLALPISHSFGLGRLRCVRSSGGTIVFVNGFTNIKGFFRLIEDFKVTGLAFVPSAWSYIKKMSGIRILDYVHQLKYIEIGSEFMSVGDKMELCKLLPHTNIFKHYGLTED